MSMSDDDKTRLRPENLSYIRRSHRDFTPGFDDHQRAERWPELADEQLKTGRASAGQRFLNHLQFNGRPFHGQKPLFEIDKIVRTEAGQNLSVFQPVMFCFSTPGRKVQEKDITVRHQNRASLQIQVIRIGDRRVMIAVYEKCFPACLVTDSSQIGGQLSPYQSVFTVPHFGRITIENHRTGTMQKGGKLVRMLDQRGTVAKV